MPRNMWRSFMHPVMAYSRRKRSLGTGAERASTSMAGFVAAPMTAHVSGNALFAAPNTIARDIVKAIDRGKDVVNLPPWGPNYADN
jgi:hypothetical protein